MGQDGLLTPLLVAHAKFVPEQARHGALAGTNTCRPFGQGGAFGGGAQHGLAQGAQAFVAGLRMGQGNAQRLRVGMGDFVQYQRAEPAFARRAERLACGGVKRLHQFAQ